MTTVSSVVSPATRILIESRSLVIGSNDNHWRPAAILNPRMEGLYNLRPLKECLSIPIYIIDYWILAFIIGTKLQGQIYVVTNILPSRNTSESRPLETCSKSYLVRFFIPLDIHSICR